MDFVYIIAGLLLLFFGGEGLIRGAVSIALSMNLSKLLVSAVIIGFGTSMPEMTVSVGAALKGSPDIALGNIIGSNIANILLGIGISAVIFPIMLEKIQAKNDVIALIIASLILVVLAQLSYFHWQTGIVMVAGLVFYVYKSYQAGKSSEESIHIEEDVGVEKPMKGWLAAIYCIGGLGALIYGAGLFVEGSVNIARSFGISEVVIGLTLVAIGTSLPEIATAVIASLKKHGDVVIGNVLGSNIFNILSILGFTSLIADIPVNPQLLVVDIWLMLATALILSGLMFFAKSIGRAIGAIFLVAYFGYIYYLYSLPAAV